MMNTNRLIPILIAALLLPVLACFGLGVDGLRSDLEFTLDNASLVYLEGAVYLDLDVMLSGQGINQRLGTGIVYLNYNPQVFGENVKISGNVTVQRGALLSTPTFPIYSLIINDNNTARLAITYEYLYTTGGGNMLCSEPQSLLNIRFRVLNSGQASGLSFQGNLMQGEQYMDDNITLFAPVIATDLENDIIPARPEAVAVSMNGDSVSLSWQECPGCVYTVYSSADPLSEDWQLEAMNLSSPCWQSASSGARMFFRVTATGLPGR